MKKTLLFIATVVIAASIFAQAPQKMSYQAVIRDADNNLVTNHVIGLKISLLKGSPSGIEVCSQYSAPTTNSNGLVTAEILCMDSLNIDWGNDLYFIKTETDPDGGDNYTITGISQLLSVPYAFYANVADSVVQQPWIIFQDSTNSVIGNNEPIINNGLDNLFLGSYSGATNEIGAGNTFLGSNTGTNNTNGNGNIGIGKNALSDNDEGSYNIAIGYNALKNNKVGTGGIGSQNIAIGYNALSNAVSASNVALGATALYSLTVGGQNTAIGEHAMRSLFDGSGNTSVGYASMIDADSSAFHNVVVGCWAGQHTSGNGNVYIGYQSGQQNYGSGNIFLGYLTGTGITNYTNKLIINSGTGTPLIYGEFDNKVVKITDVLQLTPRTSAPSNPTEGTLYVDNSTHHIYCYLNGSWKQLDN